jgi:NAD(P)H-hydrate epimerase
MKLLTAHEMRRLDEMAIREHGIKGLQLMENAGLACVAEISELCGGRSGRALVVAGTGNNGGDGFVIARHLRKGGWQVHIFLVGDVGGIAGDAAVNLGRLDLSSVPLADDTTLLPDLLAEADLVVDALFGTGLAKEVTGIHRQVIDMVNAASREVMAVDIPSGVNATTGQVMGAAIRADVTVTFAAAKLGHVIYPGCELTGRLVVADIGIPPELLDSAEGGEYFDLVEASRILRRRPPNSHKGSFGHCLVIAGSTGKTGAAAMAANSAVRGGAGLVTVAVPASLNMILEMKTDEAMSLPIDDRGTGHFLPDSLIPLISAAEGKEVVAIGPGISQQEGVRQVVETLLSELTQPLVVDADGLNALSPSSLQGKRRCDTLVLTPHPGEMARMAGCTVAEIEADRLGQATGFARTYGVWLILKGARTIIAAPDGRYALNGSGNPGMASGGMGDVLTGVVAALLAQGYDPWEACRLGVFAHGHAADLVAADYGEMGLAARDVQEHLPVAFLDILSRKETFV